MSIIAHHYFFFFVVVIVANLPPVPLSTNDQADVSFGSIQPSLSSSLSESSDSDNSIATRRAKIEATSCKPVLRSISFCCSHFSTFRKVMPGKEKNVFKIEFQFVYCIKQIKKLCISQFKRPEL